MPEQLPKNNPASIALDYTDTKTTIDIILLTLKDFLFWWYIQMPYKYVRTLVRIFVVLDDKFSISLLIKTFGIPWHRDQKIVGYFMGVVVRIVYLPIAISIWILSVAGYFLFIILWLMLPIVAFIFLFLTPFIK